MTRDSDLAELVGRLAEVRVLAVGDLMLDRFVYGAVERISPEAPVPVLRIEREQALLGGINSVVDTIMAMAHELPFDGEARIVLPAALTDVARITDRATFVVDPDGVIQIMEITCEGVGRNANELTRKIKAAQYVRANPGQVCPAAWEEGGDTLAPSLDLVGKI